MALDKCFRGSTRSTSAATLEATGIFARLTETRVERQSLARWSAIESRSRRDSDRWRRARRARIDLLNRLGEADEAEKLTRLTRLLYPNWDDAPPNKK